MGHKKSRGEGEVVGGGGQGEGGLGGCLAPRESFHNQTKMRVSSVGSGVGLRFEL